MFSIPDNIQQQMQEAAKASQRQQESRDRILAEILKLLQSISTDTYGVTHEHGEIVNMLCYIAADTKAIREYLERHEG